MANEITLNFSLAVRNSNLVEVIQPGVQSITQSAMGGPAPGYITVGTGEESPTLSELSTLGLCFMQNLDGTNYIDVGFSTGVYGIRIQPGEIAFFRLKPGSTVYMKANSAACKCIVKAFED